MLISSILLPIKSMVRLPWTSEGAGSSPGEICGDRKAVGAVSTCEGTRCITGEGAHAHGVLRSAKRELRFPNWALIILNKGTSSAQTWSKTERA